jgi:hypothetical protein
VTEATISSVSVIIVTLIIISVSLAEKKHKYFETKKKNFFWNY